MKLIVDKLSVLRDSRAILANLSFAVEAGQSLLLIGPNGAGKTTLIRTLAGLLPAAAGRFWLEAGRPDQSIGELCHYVGHLNAVKSTLTVAENAEFWQRFLGGGGQDLTVALDSLWPVAAEAHSGRLPVRGAKAPPHTRPPAAGATADLAAGRAGGVARRGCPGCAEGRRRGAARLGRPCHCRHAPAARLAQ